MDNTFIKLLPDASGTQEGTPAGENVRSVEVSPDFIGTIVRARQLPAVYSPRVDNVDGTCTFSLDNIFRSGWELTVDNSQLSWESNNGWQQGTLIATLITDGEKACVMELALPGNREPKGFISSFEQIDPEMPMERMVNIVDIWLESVSGWEG